MVFTRAAGAGLDDLAGDDASEIDEPIGLDDLFMIQYTSGTSGRPKGVMLTHGNVVWNVVNLLVDIDLGSDEVALVTAPLFHTAALNQVLFPTVLKGGTALIEARFDPARAVDLIESERVTLLFGVTSMYLALVGRPALRRGRPGQPAAGPERRRADPRGAAAHLARPRADDHPGLRPDRGLSRERRCCAPPTASASSARRARPASSPTCAWSSTTARQRTDEPGEVLVSGPNVSPGYWQDEDATARAFEGGWLHTGDVAIRDDEGYLRIVDRLKDMYISGGENVYPAEVEQALHTHPAVAECAVIGVPDERWGEVGRAFVVVRREQELDEPTLLAHLDGRLARYKLPRSVVFVPELPHNASGKLLKSRLREVAP